MRLVSSFPQSPPPDYDHDLETAVQVIIHPVPGNYCNFADRDSHVDITSYFAVVWRWPTNELT